ncbi:MAG: LytTR family transcriptional regulator [Lachnospiraceae bacterium]|nr:LytTR family transcriptional regulator [Lachnospiraceae bacterium]
MKIRMEIEENLEEEEIVIRCRSLSNEIVALQRKIAEAAQTGMQMEVTRGERSYFLALDEILFFETDMSRVAVHTAEQIYEIRMRLYELEELLPGMFMRISKSAIVNVSGIRAIRKNLTGASEVEFVGTNKKAFVSRNYFKPLMSKLEEKRLIK